MRDEPRGARPHLFALLFLAAIAATLFVVPLLSGEVFTVRDHLDYFQPLRWFTATELQAGRLPLWNPYNASGEPWFANPQTGVFYPPSWFFLVLPFPTAYMLFLLLHVVILGWGAYLLFRRRTSEGGALLGAAALMFCGPVISLFDINNNLATLAWIPLSLWCAAEGAWRRSAIVLALAFLAGEPFFATLAAVMVAITMLWSGEGETSRATRAARVGLTALFAFGLCAVQLLPFLELVKGSDRTGGIGAAQILQDSMPLADWLRVVVPPHLDALAIDRTLGQHFIPVIYLGALTCLLAAIGIVETGWRVSRGNWRDKRAELGWLALLVFAVVVSTGPLLLAKLPVTLFRYPARLVPIGALAVCALAASGWERIRAKRRWVDLVIVLLVLIDLAPRSWPLLRAGPFRTDLVPYGKEVGAESKFLRVGVIDARERNAWISGYLNLYDRRFDAYTAAPLASDRYVRMHRHLLESPVREELARWGVGWVVTAYDLHASFSGLKRVGGVNVYRNRMVMPMASLLTREPLTMHPAQVRFDTSHARVTLDAPQEGVLVLLQQHASGWRVTVDGVDARSIAVDGLFRGVQITRGHHEVVWTYHPFPFFAGAAITILAVISITLSGFVKRTR